MIFWRGCWQRVCMKLLMWSQPLSPSMDIQVSSNFERLLFEASGRDAEMVSSFNGAIGVSEKLHPVR